MNQVQHWALFCYQFVIEQTDKQMFSLVVRTHFSNFFFFTNKSSVEFNKKNPKQQTHTSFW